MVDQLNCGARAFDYRPHLEAGGKLRAHHNSICPVEVEMVTSVTSVINWLGQAGNEEELVILYVSHFQGDSGVTQAEIKSAAAGVLDSLGIYTILDTQCSELAGLTIGDIKDRSPMSSGGYLMAVFGVEGGGGDCM
eukprot:CAMPEP_0183736456 /NCGR_PEP_ID=MMETSP0737-20130205/49314_1 /TAXON_ID=385413 /ORGANISM="Thalassiosira miniscula, Strain CCMP1093" /LENGTH=135 /DNA_ID=CAMNT_0025970463 /DNA_START=43 /DNA_END=447 /DNA_ORIENTATION=-